MNVYTKQQLLDARGKLWEKNGMSRIYFNDFAERIGLNVNFYKTGNISSASLNGDKISNNRARQIMFAIESMKIWYDLSTNRFEIKNDCGYADEILQSIEREVKK